MKRSNNKLIFAISILCMFISASCVDLLDQTPTGELAASAFWTTEADAETALNGAYAQARQMFDRDYAFDGNTEYLRYRASLSSSQKTSGRSNAYANGSYNNPGTDYGDNFDTYYQYAYATINRANYVIQNVERMLGNATTEASKQTLESYIGEARMLRGMAYFRLISLWGDVPYFDRIIESNDEVASISRTSITEIKQHIYDDFTYAWEKLPDKPVALGRFTKWGALAFRGKLQLYWACWNRTSWPWSKPTHTAPEGGWPELEGFVPDQAASDQA